MCLEERNNMLQDIVLRAYRITVTLHMIDTFFFLKIYVATGKCVTHCFQYVLVRFLKFDVEVHLHSHTTSIRGHGRKINVKTSFAVGKTDDIISGHYRFRPSHTLSLYNDLTHDTTTQLTSHDVSTPFRGHEISPGHYIYRSRHPIKACCCILPHNSPVWVVYAFVFLVTGIHPCYHGTAVFRY